MRKNEANEPIGDAKDQLNGDLDARDLARHAVSNSVSRRSFLGRISASSAAAAAGVELPPLLVSAPAKADGGDVDPSRREVRRAHGRTPGTVQSRMPSSA